VYRESAEGEPPSKVVLFEQRITLGPNGAIVDIKATDWQTPYSLTGGLRVGILAMHRGFATGITLQGLSSVRTPTHRDWQGETPAYQANAVRRRSALLEEAIQNLSAEEHYRMITHIRCPPPTSKVLIYSFGDAKKCDEANAQLNRVIEIQMEEELQAYGRAMSAPLRLIDRHIMRPQPYTMGYRGLIVTEATNVGVTVADGFMIAKNRSTTRQFAHQKDDEIDLMMNPLNRRPPDNWNYNPNVFHPPPTHPDYIGRRVSTVARRWTKGDAEEFRQNGGTETAPVEASQAKPDGATGPIMWHQARQTVGRMMADELGIRVQGRNKRTREAQMTSEKEDTPDVPVPATHPTQAVVLRRIIKIVKSDQRPALQGGREVDCATSSVNTVPRKMPLFDQAGRAKVPHPTPPLQWQGPAPDLHGRFQNVVGSFKRPSPEIISLLERSGTPRVPRVVARPGPGYPTAPRNALYFDHDPRSAFGPPLPAMVRPRMPPPARPTAFRPWESTQSTLLTQAVVSGRISAQNARLIQVAGVEGLDAIEHRRRTLIEGSGNATSQTVAVEEAPQEEPQLESEEEIDPGSPEHAVTVSVQCDTSPILDLTAYKRQSEEESPYSPSEEILTAEEPEQLETSLALKITRHKQDEPEKE